MSDGKPSAKWEDKQRAAKAAEAKFEENQRRAKQHRKGKKKKKSELDEVGEALGDIKVVDKVGPLGWLIAHKKAVIVALLVLATGGIVLGFCMVARYQLRNAPGSPRNEIFVAGTLIVIDHVTIGGTDSKGRAQQSTTEGDRLTAIDADTGKQLAVNVSDYKECWPGTTRLVCADIYDKIDFIDPKTLVVAGNSNDLIAAAKLAKPTRRYQWEGGSAVVVLEDGRGARIDPATLAVTTLDTVQSFGVNHPSTPSCDTDSAFKPFRFKSGTRNTLTSDPPPPAESPTPSGPPLSYLEGGFLRGVGSPVVLHRESLNKPDQLVSLVQSITQEKWTAPLGGECRRVWIHGPLLVVATGNPGRRAIALDLNSGRLAWAFGR